MKRKLVQVNFMSVRMILTAVLLLLFGGFLFANPGVYFEIEIECTDGFITDQFNRIVVTADERWGWLKMELYKNGVDEQEVILFDDLRAAGENLYYNKATWTGRELPFEIVSVQYGPPSFNMFGQPSPGYRALLSGENGEYIRINFLP